jgi:hypothetical protein
LKAIASEHQTTVQMADSRSVGSCESL